MILGIYFDRLNEAEVRILLDLLAMQSRWKSAWYFVCTYTKTSKKEHHSALMLKLAQLTKNFSIFWKQLCVIYFKQLYSIILFYFVL